MKQEKLNLYCIDIKYIRNLHNIDDRVPSVSPKIGKQHRIYVGTVVICNEHKYLIPLLHPVEKHCLYNLCIGESNYKGKNRCLDFEKLEKACSRYNDKQ